MKWVNSLMILSFCLTQEINWQRIEQIQEGYQYTINTNSNGNLVAGGMDLSGDYQMQLYYKQNNDDWIEIPGNESVPIMSGDVLISENDNIYVCDFAMGLYRTYNLGYTWSAPSEISFDGCSAFNIHENGTFFMSMTYSGIGFIHRSFDSGSSWEAISLPDFDNNYPVEHIEFDSVGNIFLGTINGIYKSIDNGNNWQKMNDGIDGEHVSSLFVDENDNIFIYTTFSSMADGMYYSNDLAESWIEIPIPDYYVIDLAVKNNIIMIIDGFNNIQMSNDFGNSWYISNDGLNDNSLYHLHLADNDIIYAGGRYIHSADFVINECPLAGDINNDNQLNIMDAILFVNCILINGCNQCSDLNDDGVTNVIDIILLINLILKQGSYTQIEKLKLIK